MENSVLKQYARLIAAVGANVQPGQEVLLYAGLDQPEFVAEVVEACYEQGAKKVRVEWNYPPLQKLHTVYQTEETLETVTDWEKAKLQHMVDTLPCRIYLESDDPDGLNGIPQPKYSNAMAARSKIIKPYRDAIDNRHQWCIAAVPGVAWAEKVFPELKGEAAVEALWKAILFTSRADRDPVVAWEAHNADLKARCAYLNGKQLRSLRYHSANGTNLEVGLIPTARFMAGSEDTLSGVTFQPNIPSEEVFTTPMRGKAEGVVVSTKPLSFQGQLIEDFSLEFHEGKVVRVQAAQNQALLERMIAMDEGAAYLGECAFVPKDSPISESGVTFFNTLFDENAACHLALGMGFDNCLQDYDRYTKQERQEMGVNDSVIHVDFMIGCDDLEITGIAATGEEVPIFRNGTWAF